MFFLLLFCFALFFVVVFCLFVCFLGWVGLRCGNGGGLLVLSRFFDLTSFQPRRTWSPKDEIHILFSFFNIS